MHIRFKLFTFRSKDKEGSLLEFGVTPERTVNAVSKRIGFQSTDRQMPRTPPKRRLTALSLFEFFTDSKEG